MAILTFPEIIPNRAEFGLTSNTQAFESPLSGAVQTVELPGARWFARLTFDNRSREKAAALEAFLVRLRGQAGRFYLHDHSHPAPFGAASGSPYVAGAGQTGTSLLTAGWTPNTSAVLKARDYFQVGNKLRMLVADAGSDGSGFAALVFEPPLITAPSDLAQLIVNKPCAVMMLAGKEIGWSARRGILKSVSLTCFEDVLA